MKHTWVPGGLLALLVAGIVASCSMHGAASNVNGSSSTALDTVACTPHAFGPAEDFNIFLGSDLAVSNTDTGGRIALGGDANLTNYTVGNQLPQDALRLDLIVSHALSFTNGSVPNGAASYGDSATTSSVYFFGGLTQQPPDLDFGAEMTHLQALSAQLAAFPPNGVAVVNYWGGPTAYLELDGTDSNVNVFALNGNDLSHANTLVVNAPAGSTAIINVDGSADQLVGFGESLQGVDGAHVLFNFSQAVTLHIAQVSVTGLVLAPDAYVSFDSGQLNGQLFADSLTGYGQTNLSFFQGCIPGGSGSGSPDGGTATPDAGPVVTDAGTPVDAGTPEVDAGSPGIDAGSPGVDAGSPEDAGTPEVDAGTPTDGGTTSGHNCTLTIGYWKTHAGYGPQPDEVTPLLPQYLGTPGGAKTITVSDRSIAVAILGEKTYGSPSNGITKLYAQLLGAKLNIADGADPSAVSSTIADADAFLATYDYRDWSSLSAAQQQQVLDWQGALDDYNNGLTGPGHCN